MALVLAIISNPSQAKADLYADYLAAVEAEVISLSDRGLNKDELVALQMKVTNQPAGVGDGGQLPFLKMLARVATMLNDRGYTRREVEALRILHGAAPKGPQTTPSGTQHYTEHLQEWLQVATALNSRGYNRNEMTVLNMFTALAPSHQFQQKAYAQTYPVWTELLSRLNVALSSRGYTRNEKRVQTTMLALQPRLTQTSGPAVPAVAKGTERDAIPPLPPPASTAQETQTAPIEAKKPEPLPKADKEPVESAPPPFHQPSTLQKAISFRVCGKPHRVTVKYPLSTQRKNETPNVLLQLTTGDVVIVDARMCRIRFLSDEVSQIYVLEGTDRIILIRRNGDALVATHSEIYRFARNVTRIEDAKTTDPPGSFRIVTGWKRSRASRFAPKPGPNGLEIISGRQSRMAKRLYRLVWGTL